MIESEPALPEAAAPSPPAGIEMTVSHLELMSRVPAILYIADVGPVAHWHYVSPQIESILGYSPQEWCANPQAWAHHLHPDDRERVLAAELASAAQDGDGQAGDGQRPASEYRMIHRDGHVVWVRDDALLVHDRDGRARWHGVLSDITERKLVEAQLERRAAAQGAVARLGEHALEGASPHELMQEAVSSAAEILEVDVAGVAQLIPEDGSFVLAAGAGWPESAIGSTRIPGGTASQAGYTVLTAGPVEVADWAGERRFGQSPALAEMAVRSGLSVPIEGGRTAFGVLAVHCTRPRPYSAADTEFLQALAGVLADALARQGFEDDIRHRALHDPLTGLPNRVLFLDRLELSLARLARRRSLSALLFLDLDNFQAVNDTLGQVVGDELVAAVAPRLKQAVRGSDTVARFGGDEFGILLDDISDERDAITMAQRIAAVFAKPFFLADSEHFVTASIGIALARGGELAHELVRDADAAMYRAKERGRARYEVFDEVMRDRAIARLRVENDLRRAVEREELRLEYQPVVALGDRSIVAVEALVRWQHPERGLIAPGDFIPVAEQNGLIEPIGRWVLEQACRQAGRWYRSRPDAAPLGVSVNVSILQISRGNLPHVVSAVLRATGLDPSCLSLELAESALATGQESLIGALEALKETGVRLVLDDFGTHPSSLDYLTRLPLDALKVDRSFVDGLGREPRETAITEAIVAMSRALSLEVVAEGVETALQAEELTRLGCGLAQGFFFSRPVSARRISGFLEGVPPWAAGPRGAQPHRA